jgi:flagellar basal-body rod protein FlgB
MWIDRLLETRARNALILSAKFAEERHAVLAENAANIDVPDYHAKRLDGAVFQRALHRAIDQAERAHNPRLELRGEAQVSTDPAGQLRVRALREPAANALFHDGTNARLENLAVEAQENTLSYQMAMNLLKSQFDGLLTAIRGRL